MGFNIGLHTEYDDPISTLDPLVLIAAKRVKMGAHKGALYNAMKALFRQSRRRYMRSTEDPLQREKVLWEVMVGTQRDNRPSHFRCPCQCDN